MFMLILLKERKKKVGKRACHFNYKKDHSQLQGREEILGEFSKEQHVDKTKDTA